MGEIEVRVVSDGVLSLPGAMLGHNVDPAVRAAWLGRHVPAARVVWVLMCTRATRSGARFPVRPEADLQYRGHPADHGRTDGRSGGQSRRASGTPARIHLHARFPSGICSEDVIYAFQRFVN